MRNFTSPITKILKRRTALFGVLLCLTHYAYCEIPLVDIVKESRKMTLYCPAVDQLKLDKEKNRWKADGGWKSYQPSFGHKVSNFIGAQWNGVQLGNVICIYQAKDKYTFAIQLMYNKVVVQPEGRNWNQVKSNIFNCYSTQQKDCAFSPLIAPRKQNTLKEAQDLKYKPSDKVPEQNL